MKEKTNKSNWGSWKTMELIKKDFNIDRDGIPLEELKRKLIDLLKKVFWVLEFRKKLIRIIWFISTKLKEEVKKI